MSSVLKGLKQTFFTSYVLMLLTKHVSLLTQTGIILTAKENSFFASCLLCVTRGDLKF